jgi:hypothetical protein
VLVLADLETKGEQEARGRKSRGVLAQILLVEVEGRLAVQLIEYVAFGFRNDAVGSERVPPSETPVSYPKVLAVEAHDDDEAGTGLAICYDDGLLEIGAIPRQASRHGHAFGKG